MTCLTKRTPKQIHYGAEDKDETCRMSLNDPNCNSDYWWVKVDMSDDDEDSDSGLKEVDFIAEGQNMYGNDILYRYQGCQMAIARFLDRMCLALRAS